MDLLKQVGIPASLQGKVVAPGDSNYDTERRVYNGSIDKRPAFIVKCEKTSDVVDCVNFARDQKLLLAIRGGGHNVAGLGLCDDGLVIDLSRMNKVHLDTSKRTVTVQGGCKLSDVDKATVDKGFVVPAGVYGGTGLSGLTLGGGLGYMTRKFGLTIDSLLSAEIVLADGSVVLASDKQHPDLFWAIRGGGGNFGVVTSFTFRLNPVGKIYGGPMFWDLEDAAAILKWYRKFIVDAPETINGFFAFISVPPVDIFPAHLHNKKMCGIVWCYDGPEDVKNKLFSGIRGVKTPALDMVGEIPFTVLQTLFDALMPAGLFNYWKGLFVKEIPDAAIDIHLRYASTMPTLLSTMHIYPINGAASKVAASETAWAHRDKTWSMIIAGVDPDRQNMQAATDWAKSYYEAIKPYCANTGYVNFQDVTSDEYVRENYGRNLPRLLEAKRRYDPGNLFRVNHNIR